MKSRFTLHDYLDLGFINTQPMLLLISQIVSDDFIHLVDSETLTDIFPSLVNIHLCCAPNSSEDRTDALGNF